MERVKVELGFDVVRRTEDIDDLMCILFPDNQRHQYAAAVIFLELKYADGVVSDLNRRIRRRRVSKRVFERVRVKLRKLGVIDHVSRFNQRYGYREGWIMSNRFERSLSALADTICRLKGKRGGLQREKDAFAVDLLQATQKGQTGRLK